MSRAALAEEIATIRQMEYISIRQCALLVGCSTRTIVRRLPVLDRTIRPKTGQRLVRIHRATAMRYFLDWPKVDA